MTSANRRRIAEQKRVTASPAGVLAEARPCTDKRDRVTGDEADERVMNHSLRRRTLDERVAAVAGVLSAAMPHGHGVHVVAEQAAEITDAFLKPIASVVRVLFDAEEQRMAASHACVLRMPVAYGDPFIGVMPQEARERMPDANHLIVVTQVCASAAGARASVPPEHAVVDRVSPDGTPNPADHEPHIG